MGLFKKPHVGEEEKRMEALLEAAMANCPSPGQQATAAFDSAVAALRDEGQAGRDYVLGVAKKGVPLKKLDGLWAAIAAMDASIAPGVVDVMRTGSDSAQVRAAKALCTLAQSSPDVRDVCVSSLREIMESGDEQYNEYLRQTAKTCLEQLSAAV